MAHGVNTVDPTAVQFQVLQIRCAAAIKTNSSGRLLSATKKGGCHVSCWVACGCGRIGSRTTFQRSHPGTAHAGDRNQLCHQRFGRQWSARRWIANVGDACFCPNQLPRWLPACSASSRASRATSSTACECAALHSGNTFQERLKAAVLVIVRSFSIRKIRLSDAWP